MNCIILLRDHAAPQSELGPAQERSSVQVLILIWRLWHDAAFMTPRRYALARVTVRVHFNGCGSSKFLLSRLLVFRDEPQEPEFAVFLS